MNKKCAHSSAKKDNCRYCPDCGKKVIHKWVIIKCKICGHYRSPTLNSLKPDKKYCFYCGSNNYEPQYYCDNSIPDRMKMISIKKVQNDEELKNKFGKLTKKTKIWISRFF